eukprot:GHVP01003858.1.p1 GENE.GHVP01003858.1~~GHVP01003858.1.p1  ORF type:complete len:190 (+),score=25.57 GHVP01003858.1:334-903(+)
MLELKKIKPVKQSEVSYFGPAVLVPKPNLSIRVTHDFSDLKKYTFLFQFDQTKIENIWTWASKKNFLVKLDFVKAFFSVQIDSKDMKFYGFLGLLQYPNDICYYQNDVAIGASTLRLDGLVENSEKSFWNPVEAKPLLGSIWSPNRIAQKPDAIQKLQDRHEKWKQCRTLKSRQKYLGKYWLLCLTFQA